MTLSSNAPRRNAQYGYEGCKFNGEERNLEMAYEFEACRFALSTEEL